MAHVLRDGGMIWREEAPMTADDRIADPGGRLVGEGWGLGVWRRDGRLVLEVPVESGFRNFVFAFPIAQTDLSVLTRDLWRRYVLGLILHEQLQPHLTRGDDTGVEEMARKIIRAVLHGPAAAVEDAIAAAPNPAYIRSQLRQAGF